MAITRLATVTQQKVSASSSGGTFTHTVDDGTDLLIIVVALEGDEFMASNPIWDVAAANETLVGIHDTGDTGSAGDVRFYVYGYAGPTAKTAQVTYAFDGNQNPAWLCCVNYSGIDTHLVSLAT